MKKTNFDYQKISKELISDLKDKQKIVISRRFGLDGKERETLEKIGEDFGICRERVRQIQEAAIKKIKPKLDNYQKLFSCLEGYFKEFGDLRREDLALSELGGEKSKNEVFFLLNLGNNFQRWAGNNEFYPVWFTSSKAFDSAKETIKSLSVKLQKNNKPLSLTEINQIFSSTNKALVSYLEIAKDIQKNEEGFYGLSAWPEINPKRIRDKAYLVFKKIEKPLHFSQVSQLIAGSHLQTVHNELIRDSRFVLIGRGIYALSEWGYQPGQVRDIIVKILKEEKKPLTREEILKRVLEQRMIKENTVFLNLNNRQYFAKDSQGRYTIREI